MPGRQQAEASLFGLQRLVVAHLAGEQRIRALCLRLPPHIPGCAAHNGQAADGLSAIRPFHMDAQRLGGRLGQAAGGGGGGQRAHAAQPRKGVHPHQPHGAGQQVIHAALGSVQIGVHTDD